VPDFEDAAKPNPFLPFCSERCKLIDLGRWLGEKYSVPVADPDKRDESLPPPEDDL
jgi:uncharacterized protein